MLLRRCSNCEKKALRIPTLGTECVCENCFARFKLAGWASGMVSFVAAFFGSITLILVLMFFHWLTLVVVFIVIPIGLHIAMGYFGPLKLIGVRGAKANENS